MPNLTRAARALPRRNKIAIAISSRIEAYIQWAGFAFWGFLTIFAIATFLGIRLA
jgi:hypothetical protein